MDANANRAREALRVLEDYARFVLDSGGLSGELKAIRHDLAGVLGGVLAEAILHRDTPGDVGTANKTQGELARADVGHVVTAAGKRLGEAFRTIEEFAKVSDPGIAQAIEGLRYQWYDIERRVALTLRPGVARLAEARLYVLITESACAGDWFETAERAIEGGADVLQLREKGLEGGELLRRAKRLVELCRGRGVISIINDRADVALLSGADGVHVGQGDLLADEARRIVGRERIVGVSTHCIEQARAAVEAGADYIGVGPFFRSATKPRDFVAGPEYARQVAAEIGIPAFAIAGITAENVDEVLATGIRGIAVTAAVTGAGDPAAAARELKEGLTSAVGQALQPVIPPMSGRHSCPLEAVERTTGTSACATGERTTVEPTTGTSACPTGSVGLRGEVIRHRRHLPHWEMQGATYFVTYRKAGHAQAFEAEQRRIILEHLLAGDGRFYELDAVVVMPDHVHLLIRAKPGASLSKTMQGIKGVSARLLNQAVGVTGAIWQSESFDRIVRDQAEYDEKLNYMYLNPVRRELVEDPEEWDAFWFRAGAGR